MQEGVGCGSAENTLVLVGAHPGHHGRRLPPGRREETTPRTPGLAVRRPECELRLRGPVTSRRSLSPSTSWTESGFC